MLISLLSSLSRCQAAFEKPIVCKEMHRVTFTVGGGKLVRQKYPESLSKDLAQALRSIGFQEDGGAHVHLSCQGTFKSQKDTDKNLLFLHVFPRVSVEQPEDACATQQDAKDNSQERFVVVEPLEDVKGLLPELQSLSQKKALLKVLRSTASCLSSCEEKLASMQALSDQEQDTYDSAVDITAKVQWLAAEMEGQVANGPLTSAERADLLNSLSTKMNTVAQQLRELACDGREDQKSAKKAAKLEQMQQSLLSKKQAVEKVVPSVVPVKRIAMYVSLKQQLAELNRIENHKGTQSLASVKLLNKKPALLEQLVEVEQQNMGYFETPEEFQARMEQAEREFKHLKGRGGGRAGSGGGGGGGGSSNGFSVVSNRSNNRGGARAHKPATSASSNPWGALAID